MLRIKLKLKIPIRSRLIQKPSIMSLLRRKRIIRMDTKVQINSNR